MPLLKLINRVISLPIILLIKIYQKVVSPLTQQSCRYYPSCSNYALQSFQKYNIIKALFKSIWRVLRCNPYSKGGVDFP